MAECRARVGNIQGKPGTFCTARRGKSAQKKKNATRMLKSPIMSVCPRETEPKKVLPMTEARTV